CRRVRLWCDRRPSLRHSAGGSRSAYVAIPIRASIIIRLSGCAWLVEPQAGFGTQMGRSSKSLDALRIPLCHASTTQPLLCRGSPLAQGAKCRGYNEFRREYQMSEALVTSNLPIPSVAGSLDAYIGAVHRVPVLSAKEEHDLAVRYHDEEDLEAARRLVMSHLRFVVHVARGYNGYGLQLADLIQEGNIGLMKAVKRFDPDQGVRLVSFAVHWIRAEMHEFILRNWRIVKVATTKAQRKLFFNLRKSK